MLALFLKCFNREELGISTFKICVCAALMIVLQLSMKGRVHSHGQSPSSIADDVLKLIGSMDLLDQRQFKLNYRPLTACSW